MTQPSCVPATWAGPRPTQRLAVPVSVRPRDNMVHVPGGTFLMGSDDREGYLEDGEGPVREVQLRPFVMDATAVSNVQFATFVAETGYTTQAEHSGWSFVFAGLL